MPFTTREIESPDPVTRVAAADAALREPEQRRYRREDGAQHGAVASGDARRFAARARARWRDHHQSHAGHRFSASRRRENRREHAIQPVRAVHRPARLSRAALEQRGLRAGGGKIDGLGNSAARKSDPRDLLRNVAHFLASARARRDGARSRRDDGFSLHVHRARKTLRSVRAA